MGNRIFKTVILLTSMLAFWSLECKASSAIDLYKFYKKELIVEIPEEVTNKIKSYDNAKIYAQMYTYVVNSEYDKADIELRLETINSQISNISTQLLVVLFKYSFCNNARLFCYFIIHKYDVRILE